MKLYEIQAEYLKLLDQCDPETGELMPGIEDQLAALDGEITTKGENIFRMIRQWEANAEGYKMERDRLAKLYAAETNKVDRIKKWFLSVLQNMGISKLDTDNFKSTVCKNSVPTATLAEGAEIPKQYERIKIELDTKKVVEDWKAGNTLPAGITVVQGSHIRIR